MNRNQLSNRLRQGCCLVLSYVLLLSATVVPTFAQTGPQPGNNDPAGKPDRYNIFPSHDVMAFIPEGNMIQQTPYGFDRSFNQNPLAYQYPMSYQTANQLFGASGRILIPDKAQVVYARRSGSNVAVCFYGPGSFQPSTAIAGLADRVSTGQLWDTASYQMSDFIDVAAADVDKVPDASGNNHDEVIVAYAGPGQNNQLTVNLAVVDYTSDQNDPLLSSPQAVTTATLSHTINAGSLSVEQNGFLPVDNMLAVASGDFDGDGQNEIAVLSLQDSQTIWLTTLRYTNDGKGNRALKQVSSVSDTPLSDYFGASVDLVAGDFNGDGKDELVEGVILSQYSTSQILWPLVNNALQFAAVKSDANLNLTVAGKYSTGYDAGLVDATGFSGTWARMQLASGLFTFDPSKDPSLNRRQFAAARNADGENAAVRLAAFSVSDDLQTISPIGSSYDLQTLDNTSTGQRFSMAAGNFRGNGDIQDPVWSLGVQTWTKNGRVDLWMVPVTSSGITGGAVAWNYGSTTPDIPARMPLVAADLEGKSVYLGAPVHLTAENMINTDFILQEPPKHAYYDNKPQSPTYGQVVTVSRYDSFNVALKTSQGTTFSGTSTDNSTWDIGGSVTASAGATVKGSAIVAKTSFSADVTAKVGYDYNQNKSSYDSNYSSRTVSLTEQTDHDDKLLGNLQTFDIWRYRSYGVSVTDTSNNPINGFYEIILPGPVIPFDSGGLDKDWYQPTYENGNVLSYISSSFTSGVFSPPDLGAYKIPCPSSPPPNQSCNTDGTLSVTQPMVAVQQQYFGGTSGTKNFDYTNTTGSGNSFTYSHSLSESLDVKVAYSTKATLGPEQAETRASVDAEVHNNNSWGGSTTSNNTTTSDTGLTLSRSSGDSSQSYPFYPVFYTTQDGTIKASAAITNPASIDSNPAGAGFWAGLYGGKPDPAVNLPQRFSPVYGGSGVLIGWSPNYGSARKRLRGFFLRKPTINPVTNDYDYIATAPADGDQVRVEARVYNYSTAQGTGNFNVQFQAIPYDSDDDTEQAFTSCPNGQTLTSLGRCVIGQTNVSLDPLGMTTAWINWDTTKFGPAAASASSQYRIYAVLDPDNQVSETYETENPTVDYACKDGSNNPCNPALPIGVDPGQNNEGWGYATVSHPSLDAASPAPFDADISLSDDALSARSSFTGEFKSNNVPAEIYKPLSLRVSLDTDRPHRGISHVLLYDGDPDKGGRMIADKMIYSGNQQGSSVWVDWTPRSLGEHHIFAKVLESQDDAVKGNNVASMKVNVVHPDRTPPRLRFIVTPSILWPADGEFVNVRALIETSDDNDSRPQVKLEAITHNQANDASADIQGAAFGTDDRQFRLRAENTAGREGRRVYEVVYTATDWFGNKATAKAEVIVPRKLRQ